MNARPRSLEHSAPVGETVGDGMVKREASLLGEAVLVHPFILLLSVGSRRNLPRLPVWSFLRSEPGPFR